MKRFIGIFLFILISALLSNFNTNAEGNAWPPLFVGAAVDEINIIKESPSKNIITGFATYYAKQFEGGQTATGEIFHHSKFTAASNSFALNTWVRVTNILTGRSIIVRINDRMHPRMSQKGRIVDLTYTAAKQLQIITKGVSKVKVEVISPTVAKK
jgi:rare lipoprotein A